MSPGKSLSFLSAHNTRSGKICLVPDKDFQDVLIGVVVEAVRTAPVLLDVAKGALRGVVEVEARFAGYPEPVAIGLDVADDVVRNQCAQGTGRGL